LNAIFVISKRLVTYRRLATLNATKKSQNLKPNKQYQNLAMNNQELIRTLNRDHLLSVVELLSRSLMFPDDDFQGLSDELFFYLDDEVLDYLGTLTDYERLKLVQLIINTLIHEAEQSTVGHFQTLLPLKTE
jgi:hypothetical protein